MRVPNAEHRLHQWRIDQVAPDFELKDVWGLPVTGTDVGFAAFLSIVALGPEASGTSDRRSTDGDSRLSRGLFALRLWLGRVLGWDREVNTLPIPGCVETSVRDRLPEAERAELPAGGGASLAFRPVYRDERESFMELSNGTVHVLVHYSWVPEADQYRARMAVYVKHRGWLGSAYMALIKPFRHYIVYPAMMRQLEARWRAAKTLAPGTAPVLAGGPGKT